MLLLRCCHCIFLLFTLGLEWITKLCLILFFFPLLEFSSFQSEINSSENCNSTFPPLLWCTLLNNVIIYKCDLFLLLIHVLKYFFLDVEPGGLWWDSKGTVRNGYRLQVAFHRCLSHMKSLCVLIEEWSSNASFCKVDISMS